MNENQALEERLKEKVRNHEYIAAFLKGFTIGFSTMDIVMFTSDDKKLIKALTISALMSGIGYIIEQRNISKNKMKLLLLENKYIDEDVANKKDGGRSL